MELHSKEWALVGGGGRGPQELPEANPLPLSVLGQGRGSTISTPLSLITVATLLPVVAVAAGTEVTTHGNDLRRRKKMPFLGWINLSRTGKAQFWQSLVV